MARIRFSDKRHQQRRDAMRRYRAKKRAADPGPRREPKSRQLIRCVACGHLVRGMNLGHSGHKIEMVIVSYPGGTFTFLRGQPIPLDVLRTMVGQYDTAADRLRGELRYRESQERIQQDVAYYTSLARLYASALLSYPATGATLSGSVSSPVSSSVSVRRPHVNVTVQEEAA